MIAVVDYGMGNLRSAQKGLEKAGHEAIVTENPLDVRKAEGIVLPGVGAFKDCYEGLVAAGFVEPIRDAVESRIPLLGICVGMQLLFDGSEEGDGSEGLGLLSGTVVRFPPASETGLKVPHMGWNRLDPIPGKSCPLFEYTQANPFVYFVHSYYPKLADEDLAYAMTEYGVNFPSVVGRDNVFGTQFHPEKSQREGIDILRAFGDFVSGKLGQKVAE